MNGRKTLLVASLVGILAAVGSAAPARACPDCWGPGRSLSAVGQVKADAVEQNYRENVTVLEAKLRAISRKLDEALAEGDAARADKLRRSLYGIERDYWTQRGKVGEEMRRAGLAGYWRRDRWNCRWHAGHAWGDGDRYALNEWGGNRGWQCP